MITPAGLFRNAKWRILLLSLLLMVQRAWADEAGRDSLGLPTDLKASLLVCDAGNSFYACYGHCALRMECPSEGLDVTFSYFMEDNITNRVNLFRGTAVGSYVCMNTPFFLQEYALSGRGVEAYRLNLTLDQQRRLWQLLDEEVTGSVHRPYNYLHTNCSSMSIYAVERALAGERIVCDSYDDGITGTYRHFVGRISEGLPWVYFFWTTILGASGDTYGRLEDKMSPMLISRSLSQMQLVDDNNTARPFVIGQPATLLPHGPALPKTLFTPTLFFLLLLLLAVAISVWQWQQPIASRPTAKVFDAVLLVMQSLSGLFIFYLSCISRMEGAAYNWNLLVLNPLPLLLWLLFRHRKGYHRV